jgi:hypothetical protein
MVSTGVKLDWKDIDGLTEALGRGGVRSNYSPEYVTYTWECLAQVCLRSENRASAWPVRLFFTAGEAERHDRRRLRALRFH